MAHCREYDPLTNLLVDLLTSSDAVSSFSFILLLVFCPQSRLNHPNVVKLVETFEEDNALSIILE